MKRLLIIFYLITVSAGLKAQTLTLQELLNYAQMSFTEISKSVENKGWNFYYTKNNANYKTHIWYYNGIAKTNPNAPKGIEVVAKYWFKKVHSNTTNYKAVDYLCKYDRYTSLLSQGKKKLEFIGSGSDSKRVYESYSDGVNKIDFIKYLDGNDYGVIIHTNHNQF